MLPAGCTRWMPSPTRLRWSYTPGDAAGSRLAAAGGTVYIGSGDGTVCALDAATGRVRWTYATGSSIDSGPAAAGGAVYIGSDGATVYALDAGS